MKDILQFVFIIFKVNPSAFRVQAYLLKLNDLLYTEVNGYSKCLPSTLNKKHIIL